VFTPKSLLRARSARSTLDALASGSFEEVLDDPRFAGNDGGDPSTVQRLVFCTGKVSHDALARRDEGDLSAAVIRVEQLYPWPKLRIAELFERYANAEEVVWSQEEPDNMGPRVFVGDRLPPLLPEAVEYREVSRVGSGSPATGSRAIHIQEQQDILDRSFAGL